MGWTAFQRFSSPCSFPARGTDWQNSLGRPGRCIDRGLIVIYAQLFPELGAVYPSNGAYHIAGGCLLILGPAPVQKNKLAFDAACDYYLGWIGSHTLPRTGTGFDFLPCFLGVLHKTEFVPQHGFKNIAYRIGSFHPYAPVDY